jgi:short-subunit dehydrogenase
MTRGFADCEKKENETKADILVNAAGITHSSPFVVTSTSLLEQVVQTNLMGTMYGCRVIGKMMMRQREGLLFSE